MSDFGPEVPQGVAAALLELYAKVSIRGVCRPFTEEMWTIPEDSLESSDELSVTRSWSNESCSIRDRRRVNLKGNVSPKRLPGSSLEVEDSIKGTANLVSSCLSACQAGS